MEKQFEKVKDLAIRFHKEKMKLDGMIEEKWGFHYSEFNDDALIDTLDYGIGGASYSYLVDVMDEQKGKMSNEKG